MFFFRDLNPLHQLTDQTDYQDKYYNKIMSIYHKYAETFPWGGKLTGESIKFFSPLVMWTRFSSSKEKHKALFSAFLEYYQVYTQRPKAKVLLETLTENLSSSSYRHGLR
jgi:phytochromobilin:ferredoxin oxidoreductase